MCYQFIYHGDCNDNVNTTLKPQREIHNVFSTSILLSCTKPCVSLAKNVKCGLFIVARSSQLCFKVIKKINNDMTFVWYIGRI